VVFASCGEPIVEPAGGLHSFHHAVAGRWLVMGVMLAAAGSLAWYRDVVAPGEDFAELVERCAGVAIGSEGLVFLPYLSGERTPHADPRARAAFVGMTLRHGRDHLTRAVLEGVAFGLRDNLALMRQVGVAEVAEVRLSGGGAASPTWRRILADVLGVDLVSVEVAEGAALGAALLAGVGDGAWASVDEACSAGVRRGAVTRPESAAETQYDAAYARFREHYPALRPLFGSAPA
jgi:xylulokinase